MLLLSKQVVTIRPQRRTVSVPGLRWEIRPRTPILGCRSTSASLPPPVMMHERLTAA